MTDATAATARSAASDETAEPGEPTLADGAGHPTAAGGGDAVAAGSDRADAAVNESMAVNESAEGAAVPGAGDVPAVAPRRASIDLALRIVGGAVAVLLAAVTAVVEIFYSPLRVGGVLIGASAVIAVVVNFWLLRYTVAVTGVRWTALFPPLVWFGAMMAASGRSTEGDLLLADNNWVALVTIFAGSLAFAVAGYRLILPPAPRPPVGRTEGAGSSEPAGAPESAGPAEGRTPGMGGGPGEDGVPGAPGRDTRP